MHRALLVSEPEPNVPASMKNTLVVVQRSPFPTGTLQIVESKPATLGRWSRPSRVTSLEPDGT